MHRLLALILALILAGSLAPPAAAAEPDAEIPGVPLPNSVVTGRLGGPIYDRVYQVDVPAGRVLVLDLTGSPGTDFDLYLFDATATSVYATTGLVAKSTGPTSAERLAFSTVAGGRFYIDLSGFSEVEGDFRLTVQVGQDTTPPRVSLALEGGAPATPDSDVAATVVATDDLSGVDAMQFSLDGSAWGDWRPYEASITWSFPRADGRRTLWVRVRDRRGNVSATARAAILVDSVAPSVLARSPAPGGVVAAPRPTLAIRFSEPIRPSAWGSFGLILQDPAGTIVYGTYGWDAATNTGTFTPATDLQVGATYVVSLGTLSDLAGNLLPPLGSWTIRPLEAPRITLSAAPRVAARGQAVALSGSVDVRPGGTFMLERLGPDGGWDPVEPLLPDADGTVYSRQVVTETTSFRVAYSGNEVSAATTSPGVRILVRRSIALAGPGPSVRRTAAVGARVSVVAVVGPAEPPVAVTMTLSRYDPARRTDRVVVRLTRVTSGGRAAFAWRTSVAGFYTVRLTTVSGDRFAAGVSGTYRWLMR